MLTTGLIIALVVAVAIVVGLLILQYKTNFYWKRIGKKKWEELQPHLEKIREIHDRATGAGRKIGWIERNLTKSVEKSFDESVQAYIDYIDFCNEKHLDLPDNKVELDEFIIATRKALEAPPQTLDSELEKAGKQYDEAYALVSSAGEGLLDQRQKAVSLIEDVETIVNSIARHPKSFETDIQEINVQKEQFKDTIEYGIEQRKALELSATSTGAGVAAGAAVASMAPTAAMWVATTFGTASTGTAISALSGAAATNAALAWLGGGALAAGGGGMAAGNALLALAGPVGWGIAGSSAAVGALLLWRKKRKIDESKRAEIERMKTCTEALREVKGKIDAISTETAGIFDNLNTVMSSCRDLSGQDYMSFSEDQKKALGALVNNTKALSALLNETVAA